MDNNLLNDRIGKLKNWEQTESLNEILYNALSSLHAYANDRFDSLTDEIRSEFALNDNPPEIKVAVCLEDKIDKQVFLRPVESQPQYGGARYITTVFASCDYPTIQKLTQRTYKASIQGDKETLQTQVELKYSVKYLRNIESLYYSFNENELRWTTVDERYFYKFLDVYSTRDHKQKKIEGFEIDFAEFSKYISYDKVLLWNVSPMTVPVAVCDPRPAYNAIQYEHVLKNVPLDEDKYILCSLGEKFNTFRRGRDMYVRTYKKQYEQFDLLRIISNAEAKSPLYLPVKSNKRKPGFIDSIAERRFMPTWGEAERIIHSLGEMSGIRLMDIKTPPEQSPYMQLFYPDKDLSLYTCLDYNIFREENIVIKDRKPLMFTFKINTDDIWAYETMFYALSELQLYFYDYRCVGRLA
ncbi:MAG: hypothetical protein FWH57_02165 [Oscillospiraceae bacterium]|nr:hypothetical protein [Oscillospiraceae bacterium]